MTPNKGQLVILYLRYGIQIEGRVDKWEDDQIILGTSDGYAIIYNPTDDVIVCKIISRSRLSVQAAPSVVRPEAIENTIEGIDNVIEEDYNPEVAVEEIKEDIAETIASPSGNSLRLKKLAQLRGMLATAEKEVIANKLTSHQIQPEVKVQYGQQTALFKRTK
jgi:hypothetical protein